MKKTNNFPLVSFDKLLKKAKSKTRWQVLCGDKNKWRVGLYSPEFSSAKEIKKYEKHSCSEFFILLSGRVSLAMLPEKNRKPKIIHLKPLQPVLVKSWHCGFCPDGKFTGIALVVERDSFKSWYKKA